MNIAVVVNLSKSSAIKCSENIVQLFLDNNANVLMHSDCKQHFMSFKIEYFDTNQDLLSNCDFAVTVGGDGTIIHTAKFAAIANKALIGVNVGRLGFAANVEPEDVHKLVNLLKGDYGIQKRMLLDVSIEDDNGKIKNFLAINDAIIARGELSRIIDLEVFHNDNKMSDYRADGLLFSTPTGSTAYSLSAGGPIIEPEMHCILMTPVCPHSLFSRSVLFDNKTVITVKAKSPDNSKVVLTIDGQESVELKQNQKVIIKQSSLYLNLLTINEQNFYTRLNEKLKERESR